MKAVALGASVAVAVGWSCMRNLQLPAGPNRVHWGGIVFGHRGCRHVPGIPENTLDAFKYAASRGCGGVECDVRLAKDNELVIFHDAYINGILRESPFAHAEDEAETNGTTTATGGGEAANGADQQQHTPSGSKRRRVCDLTLFELKECSYLEDPTGQIRVSTLEESILFCRENNLKLLIEIKEANKPRLCVDRVLDLYRRYPEYMYEHTTIISFLPHVLYYARSKDREAATGQIYSGTVIRSVIADPNMMERPLPLLMRAFPRVADWALMFAQERVMPWVGGCSMVCPKFTIFATDPLYKKRWQSRKICIYLWGFEHPEQCTIDMRSDGCFVSADDAHEQYAPPKVAPNFDIFGDREREREREEEERRKQLRLKK